MTDQIVKRCMGRVTKLGTRLHFGDEHHWFYLEYRCKNDIDNHEDKYGRPHYLCEQCSHKYDDCRTQYSSRFIHGLIGGPFGAKSRIYGSDWYNDALKKYGKPCPEYIQAATNAQCVVYDSLVKDGIHIYNNDEMPPKKPVRVVRILKSAPNEETVNAVIPTPPSQNSTRKRTPAAKPNVQQKKETPEQKKPRRTVKKKVESDSESEVETEKVQQPPQQSLMPERFLSLTVSAIEVVDAPKEVCDIEYITPEKQDIAGVVYYVMKVDEDNAFVYSVDVDDKIGKYVGQLNDILAAE